ncbi:YiiD C-terminal domain-containing protein [Nocardia sp. SSK8]|uniref:YiiD C-terminal domain-containing protein n=1 Tax=Nocardia sp. SSK8 TaxID=3120154 RepID=UPI00300B1D7C
MTDDTDDMPPYVDIINGALEFTIPAAHKLGITAVEVRPGFAVTAAPIHGNSNHFGVMYAGVLFTVAEMLGGAIAIASFDNSLYYPLVKKLEIDFRKPADSDVRAEASLDDAEIARISATADTHGKCDFTLAATVTAADGTVVAVTTGSYQLRAHGK